jgi:hypothetical protein
MTKEYRQAVEIVSGLMLSTVTEDNPASQDDELVKT